MVISSKVRYQKKHNECGFNFHYDFVPYRPYRVLKKQQKVDMFWVPFYVIFLIWAFSFESIKNSKYWYKIKILKICRKKVEQLNERKLQLKFNLKNENKKFQKSLLLKFSIRIWKNFECWKFDSGLELEFCVFFMWVGK